jgi:hypothetical protein
VRACVVQLEAKGKLANRFAHPFRKRKPWALDVFQRPIESAPETGRYGCDDVTGVRP